MISKIKGENPSQIFARTSIIETETHLSLTLISPVALVKRIDNSPSSVLEQNIQKTPSGLSTFLDGVAALIYVLDSLHHLSFHGCDATVILVFWFLIWGHCH
ncbi:hypothetical protein NC651_025814 [Populus alba x Populus x berolinensis]|nr:hypothetical protein NC651_025803 [Populus alba x Populus x berolinensis]KAJ6892720.1 hypothetical protein NC651_025814 [Populus alba x Populus x berolinensis]